MSDLAERLREQGYSEQDIKRWTCEHTFGDWEERTAFGCTRSCTKCGVKMCDPNHCGQQDAKLPR